MTTSIFRDFAGLVLRWAERFYLHAHGWRRTAMESEDWLPPDDYEFRRHDTYNRRHAVNAQHQRIYVDSRLPLRGARRLP